MEHEKVERENAERALKDANHRHSMRGQLAAGALDLKCISEEEAEAGWLFRLRSSGGGCKWVFGFSRVSRRSLISITVQSACRVHCMGEGLLTQRS